MLNNSKTGKGILVDIKKIGDDCFISSVNKIQRLRLKERIYKPTMREEAAY